MASFRRTLSPVPRGGALLNGEACSVASPLSKSSSCTQDPSLSGGFSLPLDSHSAFYKLKSLIFGISLQKSSRPLEKSKPRGQVWRKALFQFFICFMVGLFVGLTPIVPMNISMNRMYEPQGFSFELIPPYEKFHPNGVLSVNVTSSTDTEVMEKNTTSNSEEKEQDLGKATYSDARGVDLLDQNSNLASRRLLIIVTATYSRPLQAYYLNRLAQTLKLVPPPLLWIVVELNPQSTETADMLRETGVMYRHLVFSKNLTNIKDRSVHQRNVALSHIETHRLDGIVYFADDDVMYSIDLFEEIRPIRRFGTWMVPKLMESKSKVILEGPICNGTRVIGWHRDEMARKFRRFHVDISGFAFNSTILWDPKRWHRLTVEPIRQLDTVEEGFQASTFIEQLVEDETQMEGLLQDCSRVLAWHLHLESVDSFYPFGWLMKDNLDAIIPLA